jgi:hypothetical protein
MSLLLETGQQDTLRALIEAAMGIAAVLATDLATGEERILFPEWTVQAHSRTPSSAQPGMISTTVETDGKQKWFLTAFNPPLDLAIIGAVHVAQPLRAWRRSPITPRASSIHAPHLDQRAFPGSPCRMIGPTTP